MHVMVDRTCCAVSIPSDACYLSITGDKAGGDSQDVLCRRILGKAGGLAEGRQHREGVWPAQGPGSSTHPQEAASRWYALTGHAE